MSQEVGGVEGGFRGSRGQGSPGNSIKKELEKNPIAASLWHGEMETWSADTEEAGANAQIRSGSSSRSQVSLAPAARHARRLARQHRQMAVVLIDAWPRCPWITSRSFLQVGGSVHRGPSTREQKKTLWIATQRGAASVAATLGMTTPSIRPARGEIQAESPDLVSTTSAHKASRATALACERGSR